MYMCVCICICMFIIIVYWKLEISIMFFNVVPMKQITWKHITCNGTWFLIERLKKYIKLLLAKQT